MTDIRQELYERQNWEGLDQAFNRMEGGIAAASEAASFAQMTANAALGLRVREGESVADAIAQCASIGGGVVRVAAGRHRIDSELFLSRGVSVVGEGSATVLEAATALPSVINTGSAAGASIHHLRIACNGLADFGLRSSPAVGSNYGDFSPDPCFRAHDLFIDDARIAGVYMGGQARSSVLDTIRVRRAGGWGFWLRNPDSWFYKCEATTTGVTTTSPDSDLKLSYGAGFYVGTTNSFYNGCKAWYTRGVGWHIRGSRNQFDVCESQDTMSHGWKVEYDQNVFSNCKADTASMYDTGGKLNGADGWYVDGVGTNVFVGVQSFDRKPNGKAAQQRYGFNIKKELLDSGRFVAYSGFGNATSLVNARP